MSRIFEKIRNESLQVKFLLTILAVISLMLIIIYVWFNFFFRQEVTFLASKDSATQDKFQKSYISPLNSFFKNFDSLGSFFKETTDTLVKKVNLENNNLENFSFPKIKPLMLPQVK